MIITCYSYKGGVGRSMTLANIAELLHQAGLNVLMIDWDIEAPGLERYFVQDAALEEIVDRPGLIDLLLQYKTYMTSPSVSINEAENRHRDDDSFFVSEPLSNYLIDLHTDVTTSRHLWLLSAGRRSKMHFADYSNAVLTFDWHDFYLNWEGELFFEGLRQELEGIADIVLIDSRTGVTEMGGICTYQLADKVVMFCTANFQSIDGTEKMARSLTQSEVKDLRRGRPLEVVVVPSRVEDRSELAFLDEFKKEYATKFIQFFPEGMRDILGLFDVLMIPHVPYYAFTELVAVRDTGKPRSEAMVKAFTALAKLLVLDDLKFARDNISELIARLRELRAQVLLDDMYERAERISEAINPLNDWVEAGMPGIIPINLTSLELVPVLKQLKTEGHRNIEPSTDGATGENSQKEELRVLARNAQIAGKSDEASELWRQILVIAPDDLEARQALQQRAQEASATELRKKLVELRRWSNSEMISDLDIALNAARELLTSAPLDEETRKQVEKMQDRANIRRSELKAKSGEIETLAAMGSLKEAISQLEELIKRGVFEVMDRDGQLVPTSSKLRELNKEYATYCTRKSIEYIHRAEQSLPASPRAADQLLEQALKDFDRADPSVRTDMQHRRIEIAELIQRWQQAQKLVAESTSQLDPMTRLSLLNEAIAIYPGISNTDELLNDAKRDVAALLVRNVRARSIGASHYLAEGNLQLALDEASKAQIEAGRVRGANPELDAALERIDHTVKEIENALALAPLIQEAQSRVEDYLERQDYQAAAGVVDQLPLELASLPIVQQLRRKIGRTDLTRPSLIIGLGGTGQWVLTYLKASLLELGRGVLPSNVALLAFDTMPQATAETERHGGEREIAAGGVRLEENKEFIHLGGNAFRLAQEVRDGRYPHVASWFQADHFLRSLPPAAFNLSEGAGAIRQFGRLAVFHDLVAPASSRLLESIQHTLRALEPMIEDQRALEIIAVGSLAGGTGSGLFLDLAFLLRKYLHQESLPYFLRGIFLLPRVFPMLPGRRMSESFARTFAAWRELNRFQTQSLAAERSNVVYDPSTRFPEIPSSEKAFDACYLIDGVGGSLAASSKSSRDTEAFVSVADTILSFLDRRSGASMTENVSQYLIPALARHPDEPLYGSMGSFTTRIPIGYIQKEFAIRLALRFLDHMVGPMIDQLGQATSGPANAALVAHDAQVSEEVFRFLSGKIVGGASAGRTHGTPFLGAIAEQIRNGADTSIDIHQAWAGAAVQRSTVTGTLSWLPLLTQLGDSPEAISLRQDVDRIVSTLLVEVVPPSRVAGDKPLEAITRVRRQVPEFRAEFIGSKEVTTASVSRGAFGKALTTCSEVQISLFVQMICVWLTDLLNENPSDPFSERLGKLKYTENLLAELVHTFDRFQMFQRQVNMMQDEIDLELQLMQDVQSKERAYFDRANSPRLFDFITKADYQSQERYLDAEQRFIWYRQNQITNEIVAETVRAMRSIAERAQDELRKWAEVLAQGPNSIFARLRNDAYLLQAANQRDHGLTSVQQLIADASIPIDDETLLGILQTLSWKLERVSDGLKLDFMIGGVEQPRSPKGSVQIAQALLRQASSHFPFYGKTTVGQELLRLFDSDVPRMSDHLRHKSIAVARTTGEPDPAQRNRFLCVQTDSGAAVSVAFRELTQHIQSGETTIQTRLVDSEDPYRFTVVRTDEMIPAPTFIAWEECRDKYLELMEDEPEQGPMLHVFPAEVAAARYERKLRHRWGYSRIFHPRVVNLLEHEQRLQQFLVARTYGFICRQQVSGSKHYYSELILQDTTIWLSNPNAESDVFGVMAQFLIRGTDVRKNTNALIDYQLLQELIHVEQNRLGRKMAGELFSIQLNEGLVAEQRELATQFDKRDPDRSQCYRDLADLVEMMLLDQMELLTSQPSAIDETIK